MSEQGDLDVAMDPTTLYREDIITDQRVGTIRQMTPITPDGATDPARAVVYVGQTQILTQAGTLPITFEIPATTLAQAVAGFGDAAKQGIDDTLNELQQLRRQAASGLVIPDAGTTSSILGGGGGPQGGGKIRLT